jgi:hypothetical protein
MGKAIPVALLLSFSAGWAAAVDDLGDRFNDAFGDTPPAVDAAPAVAPAAPTATPAPLTNRGA